MTLWQFLRERMLKHPLQTIGEADTKLTYEDTVIFAETFAKKIKGESCCAIYCHSEMAACLSLLACFAAKTTALPLSHRYGAKHCQKILDTVSPTCLITDIQGELSALHITDNYYVAPSVTPALILCTSGTTGTPKGAMLTERGIMTNVQDIAEYLTLKPEDNILISRPLYHSGVLTGELLVSLVKGVKILFSAQKFDPLSLIATMRKKGITAFGTTPTLLRLLLRFLPPSPPLPLRHLMISGECMDTALGKQARKKFPRTAIYHGYGLTEAGPRVSVLPPTLFDQTPTSVGFPLKSVSVQIRDKSGNLQKRGKTGLLWVRGKNVMAGYYNAPKLTRRVLKRGWLCTGDIAVLDRKKMLFIKGRADDMIIRAGVNIYPAEVESVLKEDPHVRDALIYSVDTPTGKQLGLKIVGDFSDTNEVRELCVARLPAFQVPSNIEIVAEIPRNGAGKMSRRTFP